MKTIKVKCWECGHEQKTILDADSVDVRMHTLMLIGSPKELDCPKCGLATMEENDS